MKHRESSNTEPHASKTELDAEPIGKASESPTRECAGPAVSPAEALAEAVIDRHNNQHNCAQSTACAFAHATSLDEDTLFRVMEGFGAGMGGNAETCGVVSAGVAIIGLLNSGGKENRTTKQRTYEIADEFVERFRAECGSTCCRKLKEASPVPTPHRCDSYMRTGARLLTETLAAHKLA